MWLGGRVSRFAKRMLLFICKCRIRCRALVWHPAHMVGGDYYDIITLMDRQVGQILAKLKADELAENTIVMFWGDHGEGLPRGKRWIYDSGIHVPLVVRWPGQIQPGTSRDDLVCFLDFAPTVLSLAGLKPPAHMHGQVILGRHTAMTQRGR